MKNKFFAAFALLFVGPLCCISLSGETKQVAAALNEVTAEYVSQEFAPTIDGVMDEVWYETWSILIYDAPPVDTSASVSVLWNEKGLYFFATVYDTTPNVKDRCNIWVSEVYNPSIPTNPLYYPDVDGAYYLCMSPDGTNNYYTACDRYEDMTGKYTVGTTYTDDGCGYTVELYVPLMGQTPLELGESIGVEISLDNYLTEDSERDHYVCWKGEYYYWKYPYGLGKIDLVDKIKTNGTLTNDSLESDSSSSDIGDNSADHSSSSLDEPIKSGCAGRVSGVGVCIALLATTAAVIFIRKKEI